MLPSFTFVTVGGRRVAASCMSQKPHVQIQPNCLYLLSVAMALSFIDDSVIRCVLLVLWMTFCFHIMEHKMGQNQGCYICFVKFASWCHWGWSLLSPTASRRCKVSSL